jgi:hypothetical protein
MAKSPPYGFLLLNGLMVAAALMLMPAPANAKTIMLGPPDPGAEHGFDYWYHGTQAAGFLFVDDTDPETGHNDFTLGNTNAGAENHADWRSQNFPLRPAAKGAAPITFSFSYELPDNVSSSDNIRVELRFFDASGTNFLAENMTPVGSASGDSNMTRYKKVTLTNVRAPKRAGTADIWVTANVFQHWTSGNARFDNFSVTTTTRRNLTPLVIVAGLIGLMILAGITAVKWSHRNRNP